MICIIQLLQAVYQLRKVQKLQYFNNMVVAQSAVDIMYIIYNCKCGEEIFAMEINQNQAAKKPITLQKPSNNTKK